MYYEFYIYTVVETNSAENIKKQSTAWYCRFLNHETKLTIFEMQMFISIYSVKFQALQEVNVLGCSFYVEYLIKQRRIS